ncbi:MAG TPA: GNAT family N-acetyltransferase [Candidatus Polarisedimenticolaceae bacterium]|nr:GNAT family N-acetyltransferase [Candidatus Polarisedimenticolaceae bacterium]
MDSLLNAIAIRTTLRPGDLGTIVRMHGEIYAREHGFDPTFEAYVAGPLAELALRESPRERLWIAEAASGIVGCVAIAAADDRTAQLRWFLVDPAHRGAGIGSLLVHEAVAFAKEAGYDTVVLWTVGALSSAARIYAAEGFVRTEERPGRRWGADVVEEKHELQLHGGR